MPKYRATKKKWSLPERTGKHRIWEFLRDARGWLQLGVLKENKQRIRALYGPTGLVAEGYVEREAD